MDYESEPHLEKKIRKQHEYKFTIEELETLAVTAQRIVNGERQVTIRSNPFPVRVIDWLLRDLFDMTNPPIPSEMNHDRTRLIVDILWDVTRCQNRPPVVTQIRNHPDDKKYPTISLVTRRCNFFATLAHAAASPTTLFETQVKILRLYTLCANCAPARDRLMSTCDATQLLGNLLASPFTPLVRRIHSDESDHDVVYQEQARDEAVLRCLITCRDSLKYMFHFNFVKILEALARQPHRWTTTPTILQMTITFLTLSTPHWSSRLVLFHSILRVAICHSMSPSILGTEAASRLPTLELIRGLVSRPSTLYTETLLIHTHAAYFLKGMLTESSSDSISLVSAAMTVTNIGCDLVKLDVPRSCKEDMAALCPHLLHLAHSYPSDSVRIECLLALVVTVRMMSVYTTRHTSYMGPWLDIIDWGAFAQCVWEYIDANRYCKADSVRNRVLIMIQVMQTVIVKLGSCKWLRPLPEEWTQLMSHFCDANHELESTEIRANALSLQDLITSFQHYSSDPLSCLAE